VRAEEEKYIPAADSYAAAAFAVANERSGGGGMMIAGIGLLGLVSVIGLGIRRIRRK
jgi:hypothetical protein